MSEAVGGSVAYCRVGGPDVLRHEQEVPGLEPGIVVADLVGEYGAELLEGRLRRIPLDFRSPQVLILRGLNRALRAEATSVDVLGDLVSENLPILELNPTGESTLDVLRGSWEQDTGPGDMGSLDFARRLRDVEFGALLAWADGIWESPAHHYVLPSGSHASKFVRIGDILADPISLIRAADWLTDQLDAPSALVVDSPTLLPLALELQLRAQRNAGQLVYRVLPEYDIPFEQLTDVVADCLTWLRHQDRNGRIMLLTSVNATGSLRARFARVAKTLRAEDRLRDVVLCDTADTRLGMVNVPVDRFRPAECGLCSSGSDPVRIDQRRFTARVFTGIETLELPNTHVIEETCQWIAELDAGGALAVHVDRQDHHEHLTVAIDPETCLSVPNFRVRARETLSRALGDGAIDTVVLPEHEGTTVLQEWLSSEGVGNQLTVPSRRPLDSEQLERIRRARGLLIVDDTTMTTQTMRALIQQVQRARGGLDEEYVLRGLVLIARTDGPQASKGLANRFYIDHQAGFFPVLTVHLPRTNFRCPWCEERRVIEYLLAHLPPVAREYGEQRLERLSDPHGLKSQVFLGSEFSHEHGGYDEGLRTSPDSYLGDVSDVGAFVGATALVQKLRNDWQSDPRSAYKRFVLPTAKILRYFTDAVISSALFRAAARNELWAAEEAEAIEGALTDANHFLVHKVTVAEIMWGIQRGKLPRAYLKGCLSGSMSNAPESLQAFLQASLQATE